MPPAPPIPIPGVVPKPGIAAIEPMGSVPAGEPVGAEPPLPGVLERPEVLPPDEPGVVVFPCGWVPPWPLPPPVPGAPLPDEEPVRWPSSAAWPLGFPPPAWYTPGSSLDGSIPPGSPSSSPTITTPSGTGLPCSDFPLWPLTWPPPPCVDFR
jgi:hypothetical protein